MAPPSGPAASLAAPGSVADAVADAAADDLPGDDAAADAEVRQALVHSAQHGLRLDKALVALAPEFSRNWLQQLIDRGHVQVDGQVQTTAARKLRAGQRLQVALVPTAESQAFGPQAHGAGTWCTRTSTCWSSTSRPAWWCTRRPATGAARCSTACWPTRRQVPHCCRAPASCTGSTRTPAG
jgi:hypothetical protein